MTTVHTRQTQLTKMQIRKTTPSEYHFFWSLSTLGTPAIYRCPRPAAVPLRPAWQTRALVGPHKCRKSKNRNPLGALNSVATAQYM